MRIYNVTRTKQESLTGFFLHSQKRKREICKNLEGGARGLLYSASTEYIFCFLYPSVMCQSYIEIVVCSHVENDTKKSNIHTPSVLHPSEILEMFFRVSEIM